MFEIYIKRGTAAWIDDRDQEEFGHLIWRLDAKGRPVRDGHAFVGCEGMVRLDAMLLGTHAGQQIVHRNNVALDCRRENLAVVDHPNPNRIGFQRMNLNAIVLRFLRAFPHQREWGTVGTRRSLEIVRSRTGCTVEEFLARIDGWALANSDVTVWTLERPAPQLRLPAAVPVVSTVILPEPSARQKAVVSAALRPYGADGTV